MICHKSDLDSIQKVVDLLKAGKVLILPTDTVYGFSGIVDTEKTCFSTDKKIFSIKGRSESKPLIQLLASPQDLYTYTDDKIPNQLLLKWPGPLTIIVNNKKNNGTTAFRCPGDIWLRKIISLCNAPIYSTSVNRSGNPVLQNVNEICSEFENECDLIVIDFDTKDALPSTIVSLLNGKIEVVRQGAVKID